MDHFFQIGMVGPPENEMLAELGIDHAIFNMPNVHEMTPLETFGEEIIPAVAEL